MPDQLASDAALEAARERKYQHDLLRHAKVAANDLARADHLTYYVVGHLGGFYVLTATSYSFGGSGVWGPIRYTAPGVPKRGRRATERR